MAGRYNLTKREEAMIVRIAEDQYTDGDPAQATWTESVIDGPADKGLLGSLVKKDMAHTNGEACGLTPGGLEVYRMLKKEREDAALPLHFRFRPEVRGFVESAADLCRFANEQTTGLWAFQDGGVYGAAHDVIMRIIGEECGPLVREKVDLEFGAAGSWLEDVEAAVERVYQNVADDMTAEEERLALDAVEGTDHPPAPHREYRWQEAKARLDAEHRRPR